MTLPDNLPPVFAITGYKNSGKTTLTVAIVAELRRRGYRVATVKHAHHTFDIDDGETDSARHRRAGASSVAIVSRRRWAIVTEIDGTPEPSLAETVLQLARQGPPPDLVLVEGYKAEPVPKLECRREATRREPAIADTDRSVLAIAADYEIPGAPLPVFPLDDARQITAFIIETLRLGPPGSHPAGVTAGPDA